MNWLYYFSALFDENAVNIPKTQAGEPQIQNILKIVFGLFGAIAVLVITIAGFRYILSMGDPQKTATAKNTIIYAAVGLGVSLLAYAIVGFVVSNV